MLLKDLGERKIIERITKRLRRSHSLVSGLGEDAVAFRAGKIVAASTDMGTLSTHFTSRDAFKMGRKIVASNATDLLSKGAWPKYFLFSFAAPRKTEVEFLEELYAGMDLELEKFGAFLVGGDTNEGKEFCFSGTMMGFLESKRPWLRSDAREGDNVYVTGNIGSAAAGYFMRKRNLRGPKEFLREQDCPSIHVKQMKKLLKEDKINAGMDVSDGLSFSLAEISRMSGKKIVIEWEKIPKHKEFEKFCRRNGLEEEKVLLEHGEDYQLVLTGETRNAFKIGRVGKGSGVFLERNGKLRRLEARRYEHFKSTPG